MDFETLQQQYQNIQQDLPDFIQLDKEFEIYTYFSTQHLPAHQILRNIRRCISQRLWNVVTFLHNYLSPDQKNLIIMEETTKLTDQDKQKISQVMRKLTITSRKNVLLELKLDEDKDRKYIQEMIDTWHSIKPDFEAIVDKNLQGWETTHHQEDRDMSYYG